MANPLKILTHLTASKLAQFREGLDVNGQKITSVAAGTVSTDAVNYGQLDAATSSLMSYVDAQDSGIRSDLANATSSLYSYVDAADSAIRDDLANATSSLYAYVDAADQTLQGNLNTVSGAIVNYVNAATASVRSDLAAATSSLYAYVDAADQGLAGDLSDAVADLSAAITASAQQLASDLGNLSSSFSSSLDAEAAARAAEDDTFLKLDGSRSMTGDLDMDGNDIVSAGSGTFGGDVTIAGNLQVNGALTYVNTTNLDVTDKVVTIAKGATNGAAADGAGIEVDGAGVSFTYDNTAGKWVSDIGLSVQGEASFDGAMKLSGSAFTNITTPVVSGKYDVDAAIHALDAKVGANATSIVNAYDALRVVTTGSLSTGTAIINLTTVGAPVSGQNMFATTEMDYIALDVMVDTEGSGSYTNDLVAIKLFTDAGALKVQIDAPASGPDAKYRLIAVNEKDGGLSV